MRVYVQAVRVRPRPTGPTHLVLVPDNWDDYHYTTTYDLWLWDPKTTAHELGSVKIAHSQLEERQRPLVADTYYDQLPAGYFSLGQGEEYYGSIKRIDEEFGGQIRSDILRSLRDVAYDLDLFESIRKHDVTSISLLRSYNVQIVRKQFHRIAVGGDLRTEYDVKYIYPPGPISGIEVSLDFTVDPTSRPPSNIHVVIGRNGAGKTTLLRRIASCLLDPADLSNGRVTDRKWSSGPPIANIVSVAFSAFDIFEPVDLGKRDDISYNYVGLRKVIRDANNNERVVTKELEELTAEFKKSLVEIASADRVHDWLSAVQYLENDANFAEYELPGMVIEPTENERYARKTVEYSLATKAFDKMSSGHKIVLLTISRLVHLVEEQSIILIDEPESHLHPPLLSAFIRALSELLDSRNGIAIIATHSPVVLQEVPASCVSVVRKFGDINTVARPDIETFGETVGVLTHTVFDLEVQGSGFYREIAQAVQEHSTYEEVLRSLGGSMGGEGRALIRTLLGSKIDSEQEHA